MRTRQAARGPVGIHQNAGLTSSQSHAVAAGTNVDSDDDDAMDSTDGMHEANGDFDNNSENHSSQDSDSNDSSNDEGAQRANMTQSDAHREAGASRDGDGDDDGDDGDNDVHADNDDDDDDDNGDGDDGDDTNSVDDPLDDGDEDGDDPNDDEEQNGNDDNDNVEATSEVPAFALHGGNPIDQALHAVTKEAAWFNDYFTASLIAQFGIDPSAVFPALSAHRGGADGDTGNNDLAATGSAQGACDPAAGAAATVVASVTGLPWALLVFAALLAAAQRRLRDPTAPRHPLRGGAIDVVLTVAMAACVQHAQDGPVRRILLVYLVINALTAALRAVVFVTTTREARDTAKPVQPGDPDSMYFVTESDASEMCSPECIEPSLERHFGFVGVGRITVASALSAATRAVRTGNRLFAELVLLEYADQDVEAESTWWGLALATPLLLFLSTRAMYAGYAPGTEWWFGPDATACVLLFSLAWWLRCAEPAIATVMLLYAMTNSALASARCVALCSCLDTLPLHLVPATCALAVTWVGLSPLLAAIAALPAMFAVYAAEMSRGN